MLSRLSAGGQGGENEGWSNIVARRQTNAEQMFNYQHSVLRSLKISASKCRYFMGTYASAESWSCNTVPTIPRTASPELALFASAADGAPAGLELGWRRPSGTLCHRGDEAHDKFTAPEVWSSMRPTSSHCARTCWDAAAATHVQLGA